MRSLGLALVVLALSAGPASAAVISIEENFCGCDPSSGDEDTRSLVVTAGPGELNRITVTRGARGVVITDAGTPLTGECRPTRDGTGRFCRGAYDTVDVFLGDGDDALTQGMPGLVEGGSGADRIEANAGPGVTVTYAKHTEGVSVTLDGVADDGAAGEGDNVLGTVSGLTGGPGNDWLEGGPATGLLVGGAGNDILLAGSLRASLLGGDGDDRLSGGDGDDVLSGGPGTDDLSGGNGRDEVTYADARAPLRLSIGDGPNDGAEGENDDIHTDVEALAGGSENDVLIGSAGANRLIAYGGQDVLRGGAGPDELIGWDDGDELDAGPGPDRVQAGALDRPLLEDGEVDVLNCRKRAPAIEADPADVLRSCAPQVVVARRSRLRSGAMITLRLRCPRDSAVSCQGRVWVHRSNRTRVSRKVRYGPIEPGEHVLVRVRLARGIRPGSCLLATAPTRRDDGLRTLTIGTSLVGCLPV